jgi:dihydrolipoamide dehydrogenase
MPEKAESKRVAVIGAGPGGYAAAFLAADLGLDVVLIDPDPNPGGVCLFRGCIPSKALLHAARLIREAAGAPDIGITFGEPKIDLDKLRSWKQDVVDTLTGGLGQLSRQRKIEWVRGRAKFAGERRLSVERVGGPTDRVDFDHAIVATGARPSGIPGVEIDSDRVMDSTSALAIESIPGSLLVVGGGYIGLELGTVYAALGSRVTVVEMTGSLLPGVDGDLVSILQRRLEPLLDSILLRTTVSRMKETRNGVRAVLEGEDTGEKELVFEKALIAVGRKPFRDDLGLEKLGVDISERGFIVVDETGRTNVPSIFAIGDVAGEPMLAHKASHQGRVAAESVAGRRAAFAPRAIPGVVYTDPEIAWCGLTEREADERTRDTAVARFPWRASGRARTLARDDGVTKLVVDRETERILGVGIAGPGAGELIAEGALAIEMGATARDVALTIHPHPTLSETLMEAAETYFGQSTHIFRPRRR